MPGAVDLDDLDRHVACSLLLLLLRHGCARALGPRRLRGAGGLLVAGLAHLLVVGAVPVVGLLALAARLDAHAALVRAGLLVARHREAVGPGGTQRSECACACIDRDRSVAGYHPLYPGSSLNKCHLRAAHHNRITIGCMHGAELCSNSNRNHGLTPWLLQCAWTHGTYCTRTLVFYVCDARGGRSGVEPDSRLGHGVVCVADCRPP